MRRWTRICCGVDGSEASRGALEHAAGLARLDGAELHLVHVRDPAVAQHPFAPPPSPAVLRRRTGFRVLDWTDAARAAGAGRVRVFERTGDPADELVAHAAEHACDVIVLGGRARRGFTRLFFGSVAEAVQHESECPVLVVPEGTPPATARDVHAS